MQFQFLGANAPLGPALSEGLYFCMSVCNTLAPLPSHDVMPLSYKYIHGTCHIALPFSNVHTHVHREGVKNKT